MYFCILHNNVLHVETSDKAQCNFYVTMGVVSAASYMTHCREMILEAVYTRQNVMNLNVHTDRFCAVVLLPQEVFARVKQK